MFDCRFVRWLHVDYLVVTEAFFSTLLTCAIRSTYFTISICFNITAVSFTLLFTTRWYLVSAYHSFLSLLLIYGCSQVSLSVTHTWYFAYSIGIINMFIHSDCIIVICTFISKHNSHYFYWLCEVSSIQHFIYHLVFEF